MPRRVPLPSSLHSRPFHVRHGLESGLTPARLKSSDLVRPYCGVRQSAGSGGALADLCRAYAQRMRADQVFSHSTAALLWGMPVPLRVSGDPTLHVSTIGAGTRPRLPGVIGHRLVAATPIVQRAGFPVTDPATTWLELATLVSIDDLIAAADFLIRTPRKQVLNDPRPYVTEEDLVRRIAEHRGRGRRAASEGAEWMRQGADSPKETAVRLALMRAGLPEPELNARIGDRSGRFIAYGDMVYPEWKVLVEYDGDQHRVDSEQYRHDLARHEALLEDDWVHIRETKETPATGPASTPTRTRRALTIRGWSPEWSLSSSKPPVWRQK